jgi:Kef-type K+ transport system membrane component KefB
MDINIGLFELLLLVSALLAMLVRRLHMPYSVGLVIAGISFSFLLSPANQQDTKIGVNAVAKRSARP